MQDDTATFTAAFHVIKETCTFSRSIERIGAKTRIVKSKNVSTGENFQGKFVWKIEHFTRLKDILKKRKITGLCVKSKRFTVGGRDCRLIVYPRGGLYSLTVPWFIRAFMSNSIIRKHNELSWLLLPEKCQTSNSAMAMPANQVLTAAVR